jgi:Fe2+ or Zn2+ uptake regulation protein
MESLSREIRNVTFAHLLEHPGSRDAVQVASRGSYAPMSAAVLDREELRKSLEASGLRFTPQRLAVYEHLVSTLHHPTAEDVFQAVRRRIPKISLATVYKALEALVSIGAATRLMATDSNGSARYDARRENHYHFRCLRSGTVHDLPTHFDPDLIAKLDPHLAAELARQGFHILGYRLELVGYREAETSSVHESGEV